MGCILISSDWSEGRCWQRLEDRWWWVVGLRRGGSGAGLWARSRPCSYEGETNWSDNDKWTISSSPTASFIPLKLLSGPQSLPYSTTIFFLRALNPCLLHFHLPSSFSASVSYPTFFSFFLFFLLVMLFHISATHYYLPLFFFCSVAREAREVFAVLLHSIMQSF